MVALTSFICAVDGVTLTVRKDETFTSSDPVVKNYPELFTPRIKATGPRVEQATAAPGEKRGE